MSDNVFPGDHCAHDASTNDVAWPRFDTEQDLWNDPYWTGYFQTVYGGVPTWGYPICTGSFQFLWKLAAAASGVVADPAQCYGQEFPSGYYFVGYTPAEATDVFSYIANP